MALQIDGRTVGQARYARDDGTLATVGEARVWDGQWRTVYVSWRPRTITLRFRGPAVYPIVVAGDETLIGELDGYGKSYFSAPVEDDRGGFYHAGQRSGNTYESTSVTDSVDVTFTEQVLEPTPGVVVLPKSGSARWEWPSRDSDLSLLDWRAMSPNNLHLYSFAEFTVDVVCDQPTEEYDGGWRSSSYAPGDVIPAGEQIIPDGGSGDFTFTAI